MTIKFILIYNTYFMQFWHDLTFNIGVQYTTLINFKFPTKYKISPNLLKQLRFLSYALDSYNKRLIFT